MSQSVGDFRDFIMFQWVASDRGVSILIQVSGPFSLAWSRFLGNRGSIKLRISDAAWKNNPDVVFAESEIAILLSVQTKSGKIFKDNSYRGFFALSVVISRVWIETTPQPSVAGSRGSKVARALREGGSAYSLSPVNHSDSSHSWPFVSA